MAKTSTKPAQDSVVIDLLAQPDDSETTGSYTIEVGGKAVQLTMEELLDLATRCMEMQTGALDDLPDLRDFVHNYPDVREFPEEVAEQIKNGMPPLDAYRAYENKQLRAQLDALTQSEKNVKTSLGSAKGEAGSDDDFDSLMAVYNAVFK